MAKDSRFKFEYRKNASKLHRAVGDFLRSNKNFKHHTAFQEYPVNKVNTKYFSGSHKFDWVIPKLRLVIECHGIQHFQVVTFGAEVEDAIEAYHDGQARDYSKKMAALAAGWRYIIISYREQNNVTARLIFDKLKDADVELGIYKLEHCDDADEIPSSHELAKERQKISTQNRRRQHLKSYVHKRQLEKAREYRKEQYKRLKDAN